MKATLMVICLPSSGLAQTGIVRVDTVPAPSLSRNLLSDPDRRLVSIYLPPSYTIEPTRRYSVVYWLHGLGGDHHALVTGNYGGFKIRDVMDSLIQHARSQEFIIVMPSGRNAYVGSMWANSPVAGNWEDFVVHDLVDYIDTSYRTIPEPTSRGLAGHSMGGYGVVRIALTQPTRFGAFYAMSPCCLDFDPFANPLLAHVWRRALTLTSRAQLDTLGAFHAFLLAKGAVYTPNLKRPPFFVDLPFSLQGDSLAADSALVLRWRTESPLGIARARGATLRQASIGLDAGTGDANRDVPARTAELHHVLDSLGIPNQYEAYDGDHASRVGDRFVRVVVPHFNAALRPKRRAYGRPTYVNCPRRRREVVR